MNSICQWLIQSVGYIYASTTLPELIKANNHLKTLMGHEKLYSLMRSSSIRAGTRSLHNSFTDLAAQISRIPTKYHRSLDDLSKLMDEEEEEDEHEEEGWLLSINQTLSFKILLQALTKMCRRVEAKICGMEQRTIFCQRQRQARLPNLTMRMM
jgi:hypothetical protein